MLVTILPFINCFFAAVDNSAHGKLCQSVSEQLGVNAQILFLREKLGNGVWNPAYANLHAVAVFEILRDMSRNHTVLFVGRGRHVLRQRIGHGHYVIHVLYVDYVVAVSIGHFVVNLDYDLFRVFHHVGRIYVGKTYAHVALLVGRRAGGDEQIGLALRQNGARRVAQVAGHIRNSQILFRLARGLGKK